MLRVAVLLFLALFNTRRVDGCGGELTSRIGQITSPNYPNDYLPNSTCEYTIRTEPDRVITLKFKNFTLEGVTQTNAGRYCLHDALEIRDTRDDIGVSKMWWFCGTSLPPVIRSSRNSLSLKFYTDGSGQYSGFSATYSTTCCGGELTSSSGQITSLNYPNNYPPNSQVVYTMRTEPDTLVTLKFQHFTLETHHKCVYDWLQIYDGDIDRAKPLGYYCGTFLPPEIHSSRNSLSLRFNADNSNEYSGFLATYSTTWLMKKVSVTPMTSSSVRVHWESPHPSVNNYTVTVKPIARRQSPPPGCPAITSAFSVTVNGSTTETNIHMPSGLEFKVSVRAESLDVLIRPSDEVTGYTLPGASEPVRDLSVVLKVKNNSVTVTWKAPCDTGGLLSHFMVILEPDGKHQNAHKYIFIQKVTQLLHYSYTICLKNITSTLFSNLRAEYTVTVIPVGFSGLYGASQTASIQVPATESTTTKNNEGINHHFDMATIAILVCVSFVLVALVVICVLLRYRGVTIGRHRFDLSDPCCFSENGSEEPPIELT